MLRLFRPALAFRPVHVVQRPLMYRGFSSTRAAGASLFGDVTEKAAPAAVPETTTLSEVTVTPANDTKLQEYYMAEALEQQISPQKYVSEQKRRLFAANVAEHGFFKNNRLVVDRELGKKYFVLLTPEEIDVLEPTLYLQLYRIKSSMKKATLVNRFVRGMDVKTAVNQLHFNPKKMATELEVFLKRGLAQAREAGLDENSLYIQALWTGSDGNWVKRADPKGRGRTGIIEHPYIHLKAILKTGQTRQRLAWEKEQARLQAKPRMFLNNEPLNFSVRGVYRW